MVQRNGTRAASGTLLMIERAWTSKNVMPRNVGVSNVRVTARCSNSIGAARAARDGSPGGRAPGRRPEHHHYWGGRIRAKNLVERYSGGNRAIRASRRVMRHAGLEVAP